MKAVQAFLLCLGLLSIVAAQSQARLSFEVASIKQVDPRASTGIKGWSCRGFDQLTQPNVPLGMHIVTAGRGRCRFQEWPIKQVIAVLYQLPVERVLAGPDWASDVAYTIEAKADDAVQATRSQLIEMAKNLLDERFRLTF